MNILYFKFSTFLFIHRYPSKNKMQSIIYIVTFATVICGSLSLEPEEKLCSQVLSSEQLLKEDSGSAQLCRMMQIMTQFQTYVRLLEETTAQALADRGIIFDIPAEILNDTTFNINKRKHEYLRFGKRKHDYLRFGKRKHEYLRFG
ncbi:FMRFamide-like neuropeptides 14 [Trichinella nelsoni]|uniref:FMRFamide-like neuropeptides 14 n=3 Tax=Trichinella TaxID=6333 RepID=A0A0V0SKL8_9BILA|nr:FMRFamide-like neuropeptides 14 [Trichinella nelsoni]